ncbi:MAG: hypothetical protein ACQ9MH_02255 [Nitrospinales bacterium]
MGSPIELNDTLQITSAQGFPDDVLNLTRHRENSITLNEVKGQLFTFKGKDSARLFHLDPVRVYLVHKLDGKWLFWGQALIQSQKIEKQLSDNDTWNGEWVTSGTFTIKEIYNPEYQEIFTRNESPPGKSYFG